LIITNHLSVHYTSKKSNHKTNQNSRKKINHSRSKLFFCVSDYPTMLVGRQCTSQVETLWSQSEAFFPKWDFTRLVHRYALYSSDFHGLFCITCNHTWFSICYLLFLAALQKPFQSLEHSHHHIYRILHWRTQITWMEERRQKIKANTFAGLLSGWAGCESLGFSPASCEMNRKESSRNKQQQDKQHVEFTWTNKQRQSTMHWLATGY
jgi:hypothetical protein